MDELYFRLSYLLDCYLKKTATDTEKDELFAYVRQCESDAELSQLLDRAWNNLQPQKIIFEPAKSEQLLNNILSKRDQEAVLNPKSNKTLYLAAAAVVCFLAFTIHFFVQKKRKTNPLITKNKLLHTILPGSNKAVLRLANGKSIILDDAQIGTIADLKNTRIKKAQDGLLIYNASRLQLNGPASINTITTPRGGQYQVILPDGSKVWLNAASSLSFPTQFTGKLRQVSVSGEAYFEVAKNAAVPFQVKTERAQIEVLGTHFNVMAYADEQDMKTTLLEGVIKINSKNSTNLLKPGQQALVTTTGQQTIDNEVDLDDAVAWKNGMFQFKDAGIQEIMRQVSRWYDVPVSFEGKTTKRQFTGRIARNVKAPALLAMLQYMGVHVELKNDQIVVSD
ncbi:MAG: FecR family protein [Sphingobacteriaceae bacterium]|nr:MAG: FecR family protein [Sphingobacteriaceae bacterium]